MVCERFSVHAFLSVVLLDSLALEDARLGRGQAEAKICSATMLPIMHPALTPTLSSARSWRVRLVFSVLSASASAPVLSSSSLHSVC